MTQKTTVLYIWHSKDDLRDYLRSGLSHLRSVNLIFPPDVEENTLLELAPTADIIIGWRPSLELLHSATKMSLFINPGAGVQHLLERFRELNKTRSVTLINGHGNSYFTAQHGVALLLAMMNKIIPHHNWMADGQWRKGDRDAITIPLRHRRVGLLGYGAINQKVHRFLSGFDIEFAILRRNWSLQKELLPTEIEMFTTDQLHSFLKWVDTLIVAVPLTERTKGLIGMEELQLLGSKGLLVSLGRGDVIDEESLFLACRDRIISGAAIDVWYDYNPSPDETGRKYPYHHPFHTLDNVVLSPHRAASPFNDLERWDEVIDNIERFATGRNNYRNVVNLEDEY